MKTEAELFYFFSSQLKPILVWIEEQKPEPPYIYRKDNYISAGIFSIFFIIMSINNKSIIFLSPIIIIGIIILFSPKKKIDKEGYKFLLEEFKETKKKLYRIKVIPKLIDFLFDDCEYIPNQRISPIVLNKSMLFNHQVDTTEGKDFIRFHIGEIDVMISETTALNDTYQSIFDGVFISAAFNKEFSDKTFLMPNDLVSTFDYLKKKHNNDLEVVKLENHDFTKEFHVLSTDQVGARYILTPTLMEQILEYKQKIDSRILISFVANRLYIAIPDYTDMFDTTYYSSLDFLIIKDNYKQLKFFSDLVEDLHLNLKIWSKE